MNSNSEYSNTVEKTCAMVYNSSNSEMAAKHKLQVMNVTWEDTGRFKGSCVGPNITDMTLQVRPLPGSSNDYPRNLPVIRTDNFTDLTGDIDPKKFNLLVGNEKGEPLIRVTLYEYLDNIRDFLHDSSGLGVSCKSLIAPERDSHVLVAPQACFLPIPKEGIATFNPVLFNYQSRPGDPAVLAILATREGTSTTILGRTEDEGRLYFNENGKKASFTGQRKTDWKKAQEKEKEENKKLGEERKVLSEEDETGLNMVLLIQVPLIQKSPAYDMMISCCESVKCCNQSEAMIEDHCDIEDAVIGHGELEGDFKEMDGLDLVRDPKYPIRVTVQFYKATSNGVMTQQIMDEIAAQLKTVYDAADCVGSLVVDGDTGRVTEYSGNKLEPPNWWSVFWSRHAAAGTKLPDYIMMQRAWRDSGGSSWYPVCEESAETMFKSLITERQQVPVFK